MIDLVAQGPVYRGHKLHRIVRELQDGKQYVEFGHYPASMATKGWARLDVRVFGNPWGISVSDVKENNRA